MRTADGNDAGVPAEDDRTGRARIRDAAIACFADAGVHGTSVRAIAAAAGVSPGLVTHHFGSKENLCRVCDTYVAALVLETKREAVTQGPDASLIALFQRYKQGPPLARYVARRLLDGSDEVNHLVDELARNAVVQLTAAEQAGAVKSTEKPYERAVVLLLWTLGSLALHEHVKRLLGADLTDGGLEEMTPFLLPVLDVYGRGVLTEETYSSWRDQLR